LTQIRDRPGGRREGVYRLTIKGSFAFLSAEAKTGARVLVKTYDLFAATGNE
jgi:hypothetical protein